METARLNPPAPRVDRRSIRPNRAKFCGCCWSAAAPPRSKPSGRSRPSRLADQFRPDLIVLDADSDRTATGEPTDDLREAASRTDTPIVILGTLRQLARPIPGRSNCRQALPLRPADP